MYIIKVYCEIFRHNLCPSCKFLDLWICRSFNILQNGEKMLVDKNQDYKKYEHYKKTTNIKISEIFKILED